LTLGRGDEQWQRLIAEGLDRPKRVTPFKVKRWPEGIRFRELNQCLRRNLRSPPYVIDGFERSLDAGRHDPRGIGNSQS
ncbi:hypothetical protein SB816_35015, partial [Achromobacter sp. SIMBA_011]